MSLPAPAPPPTTAHATPLTARTAHPLLGSCSPQASPGPAVTPSPPATPSASLSSTPAAGLHCSLHRFPLPAAPLAISYSRHTVPAAVSTAALPPGCAPHTPPPGPGSAAPSTSHRWRCGAATPSQHVPVPPAAAATPAAESPLPDRTRNPRPASAGPPDPPSLSPAQRKTPEPAPAQGSSAADLHCPGRKPYAESHGALPHR